MDRFHSSDEFVARHSAFRGPIKAIPAIGQESVQAVRLVYRPWRHILQILLQLGHDMPPFGTPITALHCGPRTVEQNRSNTEQHGATRSDTELSQPAPAERQLDPAASVPENDSCPCVSMDWMATDAITGLALIPEGIASGMASYGS